MFSHKINDNWILIKNGLDEISFKEYVTITRIAETEENVYSKYAKILGVLCPEFKDNFFDMLVRDLQPLLNQLSFLEKEVTAAESVTEFTTKGVRYKVHGLDTLREFAHYEAELQQHEKNKLEGFVHQMKFLCRKEGERVQDIPSIQERFELFYNLPASTVIGIGAFFLRSESVLLNASKVSSLSQQVLQQLQQTLKHALTANTAGLVRRFSLQQMLRKLMIRLTLLRIRFYTNLK